MVTWPQAVERISACTEAEDLEVKRLYGPRPRARPIVIMGTSGAGKSSIWAALTGRHDSRQMSQDTDDGHFVLPRRRSPALFTIPGQESSNRNSALEIVFGPQTDIEGVIFVASYGYDHIWPQDANTVANSMDPLTISRLRNRNIGEEYNDLVELVDAIARDKLSRAPRGHMPKWVLFLANKADLYWGEIDEAADYYFRDPNSDFVKARNGLLRRVGEDLLTLHDLPLMTQASGYVFASDRGTIKQGSQLEKTASSVAMRCLHEKLKELIHE